MTTALASSWSAVAHSDEGPENNAKAEQPAQSVISCPLIGQVPGKADALIYDAQVGGTAIARLTGAELAVTLGLDGPLSGARIRIHTTGVGPNTRIDGWVDATAFRFFAKRDLPISGSNVWISASRPLEPVRATGDQVTVGYRILGSATDEGGKQRVELTVPCSALSLAIPAAHPAEIPTRARTFQMRDETLTLLDSPRGDAVFTLRMNEEARKPFWSTESRGGYVHVMSRGDITIDAWVRSSQLTPLRRGEYFHQDVPQPPALNPSTLAIQDPPAVVTASQQVRVYTQPDGAMIGIIEAGAKVYPMEAAHAWRNTMPLGLGVLPTDGRGFWVRKNELPKAKATGATPAP